MKKYKHKDVITTFYKKGKDKFQREFESLEDRSIGLYLNEKVTESEIQAILYSELSNKGYAVKLEVAHAIKSTNSKKTGYKNRIATRLDLVVYDDSGYGAVAVEIKVTGGTISDDQRLKYSKFDVEYLECIGEGDIQNTVDKIERLMSEKC